jgi:MbtH protein
MSEPAQPPAVAAYTVVVNDEEQHSIWPRHRPVPDGWRELGVTGTREACLDHIEQVWTDITPRSARVSRKQPAR